jgi:hypothetical protein
MLRENIIHIPLIIIMISFWALAFYLYKKNQGKNKIVWMTFGGLWPLINKENNRNLSKIEKVGMVVVILLTIGAFIYTNIGTDGTFVW